MTAEEWLIDVALVDAGATNLEMIRPFGGAVDLYRGAIRPGVPATVHHLGFRIDDFDAASEVVAASGMTWKQFGRSGDVRFGYLDASATLGHFIEVMELGPGVRDVRRAAGGIGRGPALKQGRALRRTAYPMSRASVAARCQAGPVAHGHAGPDAAPPPPG